MGKEKAMQDSAFSAAVKSLAGESLTANDNPVAKHFNDAFGSLQGVDLLTVKGNATGTLAERVAFAQQAKEKEFQQTFMVTADEAAEVKKIAAEAKGDFSSLPAASAQKLDALYASIIGKVGYALPEFAGAELNSSSDSSTKSYIDQVNSQLTAAAAQLREARLKAFVAAFA